jgi:hypothetical protein
MEFHQPHFHKIPWNFPWNSMEKYYEKKLSNVYEKNSWNFHGIPWNFPWKFSWNSMEFKIP